MVLQILNRNYGDLEYAGIGTTWHDLSGMGQIVKVGDPNHWMVNTITGWWFGTCFPYIGIYWE